MSELRTCYHEGAHAVVAFRLARPIRLVSVRPGETFLGVMLHGRSSAYLDSSGFDAFRPAIVQPPRVRRRIEGDIAVSLAGEMGADLLWRKPDGYVATPPDEVVAKEMGLEFAGLSRKDAEHLAAVERDPSPFSRDEEAAARAAWALGGQEAAALLSYLRAATRNLVEANSDHIAALAEVLHAQEVMSGHQVRTFLRERGMKQWR